LSATQIPEFGKGFLTFSLDALFVVIAIWTACLCFFACCAKCNFKMSKSGLCACLHTIYKVSKIWEQKPTPRKNGKQHRNRNKKKWRDQLDSCTNPCR